MRFTFKLTYDRGLQRDEETEHVFASYRANACKRLFTKLTFAKGQSELVRIELVAVENLIKR